MLTGQSVSVRYTPIIDSDIHLYNPLWCAFMIISFHFCHYTVINHSSAVIIIPIFQMQKPKHRDMPKGMESVARVMHRGRLSRRRDIWAGLGRRGSLGGWGEGENTVGRRTRRHKGLDLWGKRGGETENSMTGAWGWGPSCGQGRGWALPYTAIR